MTTKIIGRRVYDPRPAMKGTDMFPEELRVRALELALGRPNAQSETPRESVETASLFLAFLTDEASVAAEAKLAVVRDAVR